LEDELERELAATEKQQADLREKIKRLEGEKEDWKVCDLTSDMKARELIGRTNI
jgi:hypothetical protein